MMGPTLALAGVAAFTALLAGVLAWVGWRRRDTRGAVPYAALMVLNAWWSAAYALQLASPTAELAGLWFAVGQTGLTFVPVAWLAFALRFAGRDRWLSRRKLGLVLVVPVAAVVGLWTNDLHGLAWSLGPLVEAGPFRLLVIELGPVYWASAAYAYALIGAGFVVLGRLLLQSGGVFRRQVGLLIAASIPSAATNALFLSGGSPVPYLDLTPFGFALQGAIVSWALFRFDLLQLTPVARDVLVADMDDGVLVVDDAGRVVDANPAAVALAGPDAALVGQPLSATFPTLAGTLDDGPVPAELSVDHGDGSRYYEPQVSPLERAQGDPVGWLVVLRDVTERRRRERALERLQAATRDLLAADSREAVCDTAVRAARESLGYRYVSVHLLEEDVLDPVAYTDEVLELFESVPAFELGEGLQGAAFEDGETYVYDDLCEADALRAEEAPVASAIVVPMDAYGVLGVASDRPDAFDETDVRLTEILAATTAAALAQAEREAELQRQNQRLEEFASLVSHDLRNPLSVARGFLTVAFEEAEDPPAQLSRVADALDRMDAIVDDLLALAREEDPVTATEPVDLGDAAREAWANLDAPAAVLEVAADGVTVEADRGRLLRLLENLFRNAVEHGSADSPSGAREPAAGQRSTGERASPGDVRGAAAPPEPADEDAPGDDGPASPPEPDDDAPAEPSVTVTVGGLDEGGFYVEDDGPGVPEEIRDEIFEHGVSTPDGGTGLGLAIVAAVAKAHGWRVELADEPGGARFEVRT